MTTPFCVPYIADFLYQEDVAEISIRFTSEDSIENFIKFLELVPDKRVIVEYSADAKDMGLFGALFKMHQNFAFKVSVDFPVAAVRDSGVPFFFDAIANNWDTLHSLLSAGASDVYVGGEIGFSIGKVRLVCDDFDANLRVIPNHAQTTDPKNQNDAILSFFIRPEDTEAYMEYVDIFEFYYADKNHAEVLYGLYNIDKAWPGDLSNLITGLNIPINNGQIISTFAEARLNCGKRCYQGSGCILCWRNQHLADTLESKGVYLEYS